MAISGSEAFKDLDQSVIICRESELYNVAVSIFDIASRCAVRGPLGELWPALGSQVSVLSMSKTR